MSGAASGCASCTPNPRWAGAARRSACSPRRAASRGAATRWLLAAPARIAHLRRGAALRRRGASRCRSRARALRGVLALRRLLASRRLRRRSTRTAPPTPGCAALACATLRARARASCAPATSPRRVPRNAATRWLYTRATARIVTTGEKLREQVIDETGVGPARVVSIPTGIDLARFRPGDRAAARARAGPAAGRCHRRHRRHAAQLEGPPLPARGVRGAAARRRAASSSSATGRSARRSRRSRASCGIARARPLRRQPGATSRRGCSAFDVFCLPSYANEGVPQALMQAMAVRPAGGHHAGRQHRGDRAATARPALLVPPRGSRTPCARRSQALAGRRGVARASSGERARAAARERFGEDAHGRAHDHGVPRGGGASAMGERFATRAARRRRARSPRRLRAHGAHARARPSASSSRTTCCSATRSCSRRCSRSCARTIPRREITLLARRPRSCRSTRAAPTACARLPFSPRDAATARALVRRSRVRPGRSCRATTATAGSPPRWARAASSRIAGDAPARKNWSVDEQRPYRAQPAAWGDMVADLVDGDDAAPTRAAIGRRRRRAPFEKPAAPYAVLHVGASTPLKQWRRERWRALAEALERARARVVWSAGRGEEAIVARVRSRRGAIVATRAQLDLAQLWHLLAGRGAARGARHRHRPSRTRHVHADRDAVRPGLRGDLRARAILARRARGAPWRVDPFPCRDQRMLFGREIAWVRRCGRSTARVRRAALHARDLRRRGARCDRCDASGLKILPPMPGPRLSATIVTYRPDPGLLERAPSPRSPPPRQRARRPGASTPRWSSSWTTVPSNRAPTCRRRWRRGRRPGTIEIVTGQGNLGYGRANNLVLRRARLRLPPRDESRRRARSRGASSSALAALREHPDVRRSSRPRSAATTARASTCASAIRRSGCSSCAASRPAFLRAALRARARRLRDARRDRRARRPGRAARERLLHAAAHGALRAAGRIRSALLPVLRGLRPEPARRARSAGRLRAAGAHRPPRRRGGAQGLAPRRMVRALGLAILRDPRLEDRARRRAQPEHGPRPSIHRCGTDTMP